MTAETLLRYLSHCRTATFRGRPGGNVYSIRDGRSTGYAAATVNRRMAAISGMFEFRVMRDPDTPSPVPKGSARRQAGRGGLLGHLAAPRPASKLRVRQPRRLPKGLDADQATALLDSIRSWRDKAIAGLMLRSAEVLTLNVTDVDIPRGWVLVVGEGDKERRVPVDAEAAGLIQAYLLAERPDADIDGTVTDRLFVVAKGPNRGRPLTSEGLRAVFRYHRERSGVTAGHPHALRHSFGTALAEAGTDLAVIQALMGHDHVDSSARYIHLAPAHVPSPSTMPAPASAARAEPARPPAPEALLSQYAGWLSARGRGTGASPMARPGSCAAGRAAVLRGRAAGGDARPGPADPPFITFLLLHDLLRPGYDYLAERKFDSLVELARGTRLEPDLDGFQQAAAELGFSPLACSRSAERVIIRLLIQTGRCLHDLTVGDLRDAEAAFRARGERRNGDWSNDRGFLHAAWTVLFHLGIIEVTPPNRRRREHAGHAHHFGGVPAWLAARFGDYTSAISGTHEASTMEGIAIRLAHFGRHLAATDPGLDSLAGLDRERHIETYLAATAVARASRGGQPISAGEQRNRIITLGRFLADITEWEWPDAPARRLVFTRDIPKLARPLPRYLPADADRLIGEALRASPKRLFADALLLARATGLRIGELRDLELDCVHEVPGTGAWLKVPLGKLDSERMVPLDDDAIDLIDRIAQTRSPGRPMTHPKTGRPAEFLLTHFGKRVSAQALRDELARACQAAGLPRQPRTSFATHWQPPSYAGCSLQALMAMLGHVSAAMSLRYARLFDATVRADYERALAQARARLTVPSPAGQAMLPVTDITGGNADWKDTPLIKSRLAGGYCLRTAAQGSCAYANICEHCPSFRTDAAFLPVLAAQRTDTEALLADAEARGWGEEAARHRRLLERLDQRMTQTEAS